MEKENIQFDLNYFLCKNQIEKAEVIEKKYNKGEFICKCEEKDQDVYFIKEGTVSVELMTPKGKKIVVDKLSAYNFTGQLSNLRGYNFNCDVVAETPCILIKLSFEAIKKLLIDKEFSSVYYQMTSNRLYYIMKNILTDKIFTQYEMLSLFFLENIKDGKFDANESIEKYCYANSISRRNLYNILSKFEEEGILERRKTRNKTEYIILDENRLMKNTELIRQYKYVDGIIR